MHVWRLKRCSIVWVVTNTGEMHCQCQLSFAKVLLIPRPIMFLKYIHDANIHTLLIQLSDFKFVALILCVLWISLFQTGCFLKPCRADCANQIFPICSQIWQSSVQGYKGRHIETIHRPIHHLSLLCFGFVFFISVLICVLKHFFNAQESL